jgi:hypothetical protein
LWSWAVRWPNPLQRARAKCTPLTLNPQPPATTVASLVGIPLLAYLYFWRLPTYRRAAHLKREEPKSLELLRRLRDVLERELDICGAS